MIEGKDTIVAHRSGSDESADRSITDSECASRGNHGHAGVTVGRCEEKRAASDLTDPAQTGDRVGEHVAAGEIESQGAVVGDKAATERSAGSPITDLERSAGDEGRSGVSVGTCQDCCAASDLTQATGTRDRVADQDCAALIED